jgi:lipoprotein-releasing system permease protein
MNALFTIALRHLLARKRQSIVSLGGVVIGVAFFLAISSMMQGSQTDFIEKLVDRFPHITVYDEFRSARRQPVEEAHPQALIELRNLRPRADIRGIRGHRNIVDQIMTQEDLRASAVQTGQVIVSFAGREASVDLNGIAPEEMREITTIEEDIVQGSIDNLIADRNGIIIGQELARKQLLDLGDNITVTSVIGEVRTFKVVGIFRTGNFSIDERTAYADIKRVQALMNRPDRANTIVIRLGDPVEAKNFAARLESQIGYRSVSWQEANEGLLNTLLIRNIIMYSVVSAVLIVAGFGIYNIISTIVLEKHRDIAILKSVGFTALDVKKIFVIQGIILGLTGIIFGLPLGALFMVALGTLTFEPPGVDPLQIPMDWSPLQFIIAGAFAIFAAVLAAWLPARKGARVLPVDILRGGQ